MRIFGSALVLALSILLLAVILMAVGIYLVWLAVSVPVALICWFVSDVIFMGNRKYGLRILDPVFNWLEDCVLRPVTGVAMIPIVALVESWRAFARNGYKITWKRRGQGPSDEPPASPAIVSTPTGSGPVPFGAHAEPSIAH